MDNRVFVLDVPENAAVVETARNQPGARIGKAGSYFVIECADSIVIDRRATGVRHAVWYSCVAAIYGCRITQWDKDAFRAEGR